MNIIWVERYNSKKNRGHGSLINMKIKKKIVKNKINSLQKRLKKCFFLKICWLNVSEVEIIKY